MKPWAAKFYKSKAWQATRQAYIHKVFGLCERCHRPGKILHHKVYLTAENINNPEISLNPKNLEYLCQDCHNAEHHEVHNSTRNGLVFDKNGQLLQYSEKANNGEV